MLSVGVMGALATAASAADVPGAISGIAVTMSDGSALPAEGVGSYSPLRIAANWAVPDGTAPGSTFGMTLPSEFARVDLTFNLMTSDHEVAGACTLVSRVLSCTLSDFVNGRNNVHGTMWMQQRLEVAEFDETTTVPLNFGVDGITPIEVVVGPSGSGTRGIAAKYGTAESTMVWWEIYLPSSVYDAAPITVTDVPGAGQACLSSDPNVSLIGRDADGTMHGLEVVPSTVHSDGTFTVTIDHPVTGYAQVSIYYGCDITDPSLAQYTNSATIQADGVETIPVSSYVWSATGGGDASGDNVPVEPTEEPTPSDAPSAPTDEPTAPSDVPVVPAVTASVPAAPAEVPSATVAASSGTSLAATGSDLAPKLLLGGLFVAVGVLIVVARRRQGQA